MIGPGSAKVRVGYLAASFAVNGFMSEVWKLGYALGCVGISIVTSDAFLCMSVIKYGLLNRGINFATRFSPFSLCSFQRLRVLSMTESPISYSGSSLRYLFAWYDCEILATIRLSLASATSCVTRIITSRALMCSQEGHGGVSTRGCTILGDLPYFSWNGEYPVDWFTVFIMAKRTRGSALSHPVWFHSTWKRMTWLTVLFVRSLAPSVCGWYADDAWCLIPVSNIRCFQNFAMNSLSRSEIISRGRPFSQYHLSKKSPVFGLAVT